MTESYRDKLNEIDHKCLDEDLKFYDLRSLFESVVPKLSAEDKEEIKKVIQNTNDAETIAAVLQAKAMDEKNESLEESFYIHDQSLVDDWIEQHLTFDIEQAGVYSFANANESREALKTAISHGYRDAWRETNKVYISGDKVNESLEERYDFDLVDNAIDHFLYDLGREPEVDDVIEYIENTSPEEVPEDFDKYQKWADDISCEISARLSESLEEELIDAPQEVVDELLDILGNHGFILDNSFKVNPGKTFMGAVHLQVINPESIIEDSDEIDVQDELQKYVTRDLIDEIHKLDRESNCPITWNFGPNNKGQVTGGLDIMKQWIEESLDISDYEELTYPLKDGGKNYQLFRKLENGKGKWAAAPMEMGDVKYNDAFEITYDQARGFEPISNIGRLSRDLGKILLSKRESLKESSELTDEDWEDFYKLEEEIANVMHGIDSDLDDAQANIYHDDSDGTRRLTFRFVCGVNKISDRTRKQIINALENYLNKTKFNQFIYIRLYPIEVPVGASYEVIINAETEPDENLTEASYGGAYDIEDNMFFTKEDMMEFIDELLQKLKDEFGYDFEIYYAGFDTPTDLYIELIDHLGALVGNHIIIDMRKIKTPADLVHKYLDSTFKMFKDDFQKEYDIREEVPTDESLNEARMKDYKNPKLQKGTKVKITPKAFKEYSNDATIPNKKDFDALKGKVGTVTRYWVDYTPKKEILVGVDFDGVEWTFGLRDLVIVKSVDESLSEDTVKQGNKWVNKGKEGTHGKFATKKAADAQRRAMFANGYREGLIDSSKLDEVYKHLNNRDKQIYINEIEKCEDKEDLEDIVHEIFFYDKALFAMMNKFPKDASFEELKANKIAILKDSMLTEDYQYKIGDEVRAGSERSIQRMLYKNNYLREDYNSFLTLADKDANKLRNEYDKGDKSIFDILTSLNYIQDDPDSVYMYKEVSDGYAIVFDLSSLDEGKNYVKYFVVDENNNIPKGYTITKLLIEDYQQNKDEWGEPYSYDEVERELKSITDNWTDKEGTIRCYWEQEKNYGLQILKKHYKYVETSDGRTGKGEDMSWVLAYSGLKEE